MDLGLQALSNITVFSKYAKYIPSLKRRETWDEIVDRYENMMIEKYPFLKEAIVNSTIFVREKKVLPSMRALQFSGTAIEVNNSRIFNCAYLPVDSLYSFSEALYLLLGGTGVGYSVQKQHITQLPPITKPEKKRIWLIEDSIMGWADSVKVLLKAYMEEKALPVFDFRAIRKKGTPLRTAGGKAPGPEPLKLCLSHIQAVLDRKKDGDKLTSLECHDIMCHVANAVLAGGIRRSALISLFSYNDEEMITCKYGAWWELNEQRGRANNSAVLDRNEIKKEEFDNLWTRIQASGSGEPGIYWTNNKEFGTNPCAEIALRPFQMCNLCEINVSDITSQNDLNDRTTVAAFFGTLQAGFTNFHYLRPIWKKTCDKDALLGIGMTGIGSGEILKYNLEVAANIAKLTNCIISSKLGINESARITCIKPSGTTSCVLGTSSGIHAWHNDYYLRTMRFNKNEDVAMFLEVNHPELCEDDILRPKDILCVRIPVKAPKDSILRTETAIDTLERVKKFASEWIIPGHISGDNTHNVSATISIDKNKKYYKSQIDGSYHHNNEEYDATNDEWKVVGKWMWNNREVYNGISVLNYDGGTYTQAPFEDITKEQYEEKITALKQIDLRKVMEMDDNVEFSQILACSGNNCSVE